MIQRGYVPRGEHGIPGRRFFIRGSRDVRTHHIHAFQARNPEIARMLALRDYMIAHPAEARAYSRLKGALAQKYPEDIHSYVEGKDSFVKEIVQKALAWSSAC